MRFFILIFVLASLSCATNRKSSLALISSSAATGAIAGTVTAPEDENPGMHGVFWASALAAVAGVASYYIFDSEKELEETRNMNIELAQKLDRTIRGETPPSTAGTASFAEKDFPKEFRKLVIPGQFRVYKIDKWVPEGKNRLVFKSKAIEFDPPRLKGGSQ